MAIIYIFHYPHKINYIFQRLTEPKLKSLYNDLMIHDKEEITHKRIKNEGGDKEGLIEAKLRKKLTAIMASFGLREHFEDNAPPPHKYSVCQYYVLSITFVCAINICKFVFEFR